MDNLVLEQFNNKKFAHEFFNTSPTIKSLADRLTIEPIKVTPQDLIINFKNMDIPAILYKETENSIKPHFIREHDEIRYRGPGPYDLIKNLMEVYPSVEFKIYKSGTPPYDEEESLTISEYSIMDAGNNPQTLIQDSVNFLTTGIYDHMDCQLLHKLQNIASKQEHVIEEKQSVLMGSKLDELFKSFKTKIIIAPQKYHDLFLYHEYNIFPVKNDLIGDKMYFIPEANATTFLLNMSLHTLEYFAKQEKGNVIFSAREIRAFALNSKIDYYQLNIIG